MNKPDSYENVMKEMEEVNDELESCENDEDTKDFKFEYAFESITERHTAYQRRISNV